MARWSQTTLKVHHLIWQHLWWIGWFLSGHTPKVHGGFIIILCWWIHCQGNHPTTWIFVVHGDTLIAPTNCFSHLANFRSGWKSFSVANTRHWRDWKKAQSWNLNIGKINFSPVSRNLISFCSKFLCSGWKSFRLMNRYNTRHFSNDLFWRCLILISLNKKSVIIIWSCPPLANALICPQHQWQNKKSFGTLPPGLLREDQRRERQEQLRPHLRAARRASGFRISSGLEEISAQLRLYSSDSSLSHSWYQY